MLFVVCKEKIISYVIALSTIAILFCIASINFCEPEAMQTSSNAKNYVTQKNIIQGE